MSKMYQGGDTASMSIDKQVIDFLDSKHGLLSKQYQIVQDLDKQSKDELQDWEKAIKNLQKVSNQYDFSNVDKILRDMEYEAQILGTKTKSKMGENNNGQNFRTHQTESFKNTTEFSNRNVYDKKQYGFEQQKNKPQEVSQATNDYIPRQSVGPKHYDMKVNPQKNNQVFEEQYQKQIKPSFQDNEKHIDEKNKKQVKPQQDTDENIFEDQPRFQLKQENEQARSQQKSKFQENQQEQKLKEVKQPTQQFEYNDSNFEEEKLVEEQNYQNKLNSLKNQRNPQNNPQKKIVPPQDRAFDQPVKKIKISQPVGYQQDRDYDNQHKMQSMRSKQEDQSGDMEIFEDQMIQYLSKFRGDTPEFIERQLRKAQYFKDNYGIKDSILTITPQWLKSFKNKFLTQ